MTEQKQQHTIYLDLDGVIFPYWHNLEHITGYDRRRLEAQQGMTANWINRLEFYFPDITKRLGQMVTRGVVIMPSSSRSYDLFEPSYSSICEELGGIDRYLVIDKFSSGNIEFKAEAVLNNFCGTIDASDEHRGWERGLSGTHTPIIKPPASKAVWIDDHAVTERLHNSHSAQAKEILNLSSLKIIQPIGNVGLTMAQLDTVEAFLLSGN